MLWQTHSCLSALAVVGNESRIETFWWLLLYWPICAAFIARYAVYFGNSPINWIDLCLHDFFNSTTLWFISESPRVSAMHMHMSYGLWHYITVPVFHTVLLYWCASVSSVPWYHGTMVPLYHCPLYQCFTQYYCTSVTLYLCTSTTMVLVYQCRCQLYQFISLS